MRHEKSITFDLERLEGGWVLDVSYGSGGWDRNRNSVVHVLCTSQEQVRARMMHEVNEWMSGVHFPATLSTGDGDAGA